MWGLQISGAVLPLPHMPSWCAKGQLYFTDFVWKWAVIFLSIIIIIIVLFSKAVNHSDHLNMCYVYTRWQIVATIPKPDWKGAAQTAVDAVLEAVWLHLLQSSPAESW